MPKKKKSELETLLTTIHETLEQQNSLWRTFLGGMVRGIGTALGATVVLAILTSVTFQALQSLNLEDFIRQLLQN